MRPLTRQALALLQRASAVWHDTDVPIGSTQEHARAALELLAAGYVDRTGDRRVKINDEGQARLRAEQKATTAKFSQICT